MLHWAWFDQLGLSVKIFTILKWLKHFSFVNTLNQIRIMGSWKGKCSFNGCIMSLWRLITICTPLYTRSLYSRYFSRSFSTYAQPLSFIFKSVSLSKREKKRIKKNFSKKWKIKKPRNKSIPDLIQFIITCHTFRVSFEHYSILFFPRDEMHIFKCI